MSYDKTLLQHINAVLDRLADEKQPLVARWIAHEICNHHTDVLSDGESKEFWLYCGYETVRDKVRRAINRRTDDRKKEGSDQYILPGYEHVHEYYLVSRHGEEQAIHIDDMTRSEINNRASMYDAMSDACKEHARELRRYMRKRKRMAG